MIVRVLTEAALRPKRGKGSAKKAGIFDKKPDI